MSTAAVTPNAPARAIGGAYLTTPPPQPPKAPPTRLAGLWLWLAQLESKCLKDKAEAFDD